MKPNGKIPAWSPAKSPANNARKVLPAMAAAYLAASRKLVQGKRTPKDLHAFRIETKHFRYTLEFFQSCYGPGLGQRIASLRRLQDYLGEINDCATTRRLLAGHNGMERIIAVLDRKTETLAAKAYRFIRKNHHGPGRLSWWRDYLAQHGREPK